MDDNNATSTPNQAKKENRIQSRIKFPYVDLETAVDIVRALDTRAVASCKDAELAAWLNQDTASGTYRSRRSAARKFGLIEFDSGRVSLTALGRESIRNPTARAEAFLRPRLFRELYERYHGQTLPPPLTIERHLEELGVSRKQKDRARCVFQRSAEYAGYIDQAAGRLIRPGNASETEHARPAKRDHEEGEGKSAKRGDYSRIDPIICQLFARLPKTGSVWPEVERKLWLELLKGQLKFIYKDAEDKPTM